MDISATKEPWKMRVNRWPSYCELLAIHISNSFSLQPDKSCHPECQRRRKRRWLNFGCVQTVPCLQISRVRVRGERNQEESKRQPQKVITCPIHKRYSWRKIRHYSIRVSIGLVRISYSHAPWGMWYLQRLQQFDGNRRNAIGRLLASFVHIPKKWSFFEVCNCRDVQNVSRGRERNRLPFLIS